MRLLPLLTFGLLAVFAGGCATTGPKYRYTPRKDSAVLVGRSFLLFIPTDKVRINFVEIDGQMVEPSIWSGPPDEVPLAPGPHKITYGLEGFEFVFAQETIDLTVEPGHRYQFKARKVGIAFDVDLIDETGNRLVFSKRVMGSRGAGPTYIPIIIPAR